MAGSVGRSAGRSTAHLSPVLRNRSGSGWQSCLHGDLPQGADPHQEGCVGRAGTTWEHWADWLDSSPGTGHLEPGHPAAELDGEGSRCGCRDRLATHCHQSSPRPHSLWSAAGAALGVRAWMRLLAPQGRPGSPAGRGCVIETTRLPTRRDWENHVHGKSRVTSAAVTPAPARAWSRDWGSEHTRFPLGASGGGALGGPQGLHVTALDLHSPSTEWGALCHALGQGSMPS